MEKLKNFNQKLISNELKEARKTARKAPIDKSLSTLQKKLDSLAKEKNTFVCLHEHADPLQVARCLSDEVAILMCALFAYGNAKNIVSFLKKLDFTLLNSSEKVILKECKHLKYRFQSEKDVAQIFITLSRFKKNFSLKEFFTQKYKNGASLTLIIKELIDCFYKLNHYRSNGYTFFFSKPFEKPISPLKRYHLFLRWMVRKDALDLGLFNEISTKDLLIPLDTHTHKMALNLGLLKRKSYDFKAVLELSESLKKMDAKDPLKYDFALYRMGQLKLLSSI